MGEFKETEFNSSVATLKRINDLIIQMHLASLNLLEGNNLSMKLEILHRLYVEGRKKFNKEEKQRIEKFIKRVGEIQSEQSKEGLKKNVYHTNPYAFQNKKASLMWNSVRPIINNYEFFLMGCLDDHGMLMKNKEEMDETPDSWED